jgi:lysophospholipase L1-like esterase
MYLLLYLCTVPQKLGTDTPVLPDRTLEATRPYASAVIALGTGLGVPVVDLFSSLQCVPSWQNTLLKDGLHFTPEGSRAVWREVHRVLEKELPHLG